MATGDITATIPNLDGGAVDVVVEGFTTGADWDVGSGNGADLVNVADAAATLTLTGNGYNADGTVNSSATYTANLNTVRRKPYPNDGNEDQDASGSDLDIRFNVDRWLWTGYTATLTASASLLTNAGGASQTSNAASAISVTNNSTLAVPKVLGGWCAQTSVPAQRVSGTVTLGFHAYHHTGIACVVWTATGGTSAHEQTGTVIARSKRQSARTGLYSEAFEFDLDTSGFTQGETISVNVKAYPVVGGSGAVLDTADTTGVDNETLLRSDLTLTCNKTGALTQYAVVNPSTGNNATGVVSGTLATAEAAPYATIQAAIDDGATVVQLSNTTHTLGSLSTGSTVDHWVTVQPQDGASPTITTSGNVNHRCRRLKIDNCAFSTAHIISGENGDRWLWFHNCTVNQNGGAAGLSFRSKGCYITECAGVLAMMRSFSTAHLAYVLDGVSLSSFVESDAWHRVARCDMPVSLFTKINNNPAPAQDGVLVLHNAIDVPDTDKLGISLIEYTLSVGVAIIGNTLERHGTGTTNNALVQLWTEESPSDNIIFAHNTAMGQRCNIGYNSTGTASVARSNILIVGNAFDDGFNIKGDNFGTANANRVGNFAIGHGTGVLDNRSYDSVFPADDDASNGMRGAHGPNTINYDGAQSLGFVDDQSGAGDGSGNYAPDTGSVLLGALNNRLASFDIQGFDLPGDGSGNIGALQPEPAPAEPTPRAPMRMSDLLTPTVSLEADPATVVATATATFYVDFEAGSDGSGTEGSPWNTLAGKEATIDAVVGSAAVVMAGIADGQQIAGLSFSNGSGTTLSFISWHLLDGAKTRAHWTPAIKMDRIDTPSMSGSVIDYDLTDIETALAARGWSGTFDVQAVLSGYTPFAGQVSISSSGLRTLAQGLVTDDAYYESFRRSSGGAQVVWEEVGSAAAVSVADTWHFDGTTDVVRARQATVPDDGYIVYLDDAGNQVVTIAAWDQVSFLGVRFFLLGDRGDRRFVQATTKRMLLQDIECEGTGAEDTFALLNNAGDGNSGLTMRRCQFSGMGKDGNPIVVSTNTTPDYKSWHSIDTISHAGWRYEYTDSVPTGGLQGTDAGILNDQATYFGAPHSGDLEEIRVERGFGFAYNSKTARLIQSQPNDSPTDYTDISDYKSVLIGLRAEGLSGIDQANVYRRTLVVACDLEGAGSAANSHLFGRNGNLGEAVGFVACILRGSVSMRSAIALWNTTNAFISRCLFHCDQNGISAKQGANAWTGEVTLDNNLYLFINDSKSWWGVAQGGGEVTATVADSIKDIDGGLEIAEAFENCDFYENTLDHTDQTSADVDATFPDNSNVYDTSMTVPANGAATSANLSTRGIPEIDGVLTVIEGDDMSINGQLHNGTFGPFQYGGFGVSAGGILSRSRLWRSRLQRI
jgi:hypothetical protein